MRMFHWRSSYLLKELALPVLFLAALFLFGGSARTDSLGQLMVVPLSLGLVVWAVIRGMPDLFRRRAPTILVLGAMLLILLQLVPLPPALWSSLPGHDRFAAALALTQTESVWRPINLVPNKGWISLAAMLTPVAALAIALRNSATAAGASRRASTPKGHSVLRAEERLIFVVIGFGAASSILAIGQLLGPPDGPLYLHRITNAGSAVGWFANRNHNAVFLASLIPLLAVCAALPVRTKRQMVIRNGVLLGMAGLFLCVILVNGSRAGLGMGAVAICWAFFIYQPPEAREVRGDEIKIRRLRRAIVAAFLFGLGLLTVVFSRAQSLDRALSADDNVIQRSDIWAVTLRQAFDFFPFGTGFGAFAEAYKMVEPAENMSRYYINHAHNDWLEVAHDGGLLALALLAAAIGWWLVATAGLVRQGARATRRGRVGLAGAAIICVLGMASFVDYPLRTAPLSALFVIGAVWLAMAREQSAKRWGGRGRERGEFV